MTNRFIKKKSLIRLYKFTVAVKASCYHIYISPSKSFLFFYGKFYHPPFIIGLVGDNEKLRGRQNDVQRGEYEDSVNVERIYHNTSEYLSWKEMRNREGFN